MKKTIAIDLDSTINNFLEVWVDTYNCLYKGALKVEDVTEWSLSKIVKEEHATHINDIFNTPGFFKNLQFKDEYTRDVMKYLNDTCKVYIVSSCSPVTVREKVEWINLHLPEINTDLQFISAGDKSIIGADYIIDDAIHNIKSFKGEKIIVDAPYNKDYTEEGLIRIHSWNEVEDYFKEVNA